MSMLGFDNKQSINAGGQKAMGDRRPETRRTDVEKKSVSLSGSPELTRLYIGKRKKAIWTLPYVN
jgi:hypothetical protein